MATRITQKAIEKLKPGPEQVLLWDSEIRGFGVRLTPGGVFSFILNYRFAGRECRMTIARYPEWNVTAARNKALELRGQIAKGDDPLEEIETARGLPVFRELAREYTESVEKRASTKRNDLAMLESILSPRLGRLRAADVHTEDLEKVHRSMKATPYRANRVLALASAMFSWAMRNEHSRRRWGVTTNPARGVPRYPEPKRERWLTEQELDRLQRALDDYEDQDAADALRLLVLTGSRAGEVLHARWEQFDIPRGIWTKPSHATKQKKTEHMPLSAAALVVLKHLAARREKELAARREKGAPANPTPFLFTGRDADKARTTIRRPWVAACKAAGLAESYTINGKKNGNELVRWRPTVRLHDLRHSFASHLVSKGESLHIVGKLLGHTQPQTTARYAHLSDGALRDAANHFGQIIDTRAVKQPR